MNLFKCTFLFLGVFFFTNLAFSQTNIAVDDRENRNHFILKTNPLSFIREWQYLEVEHTLSDLVSVQLGSGLTFGQGEFDPNEILDNQDFRIKDDARKGKFGYMVSAELKLYYFEKAPEGSYFGVVGQYANRRSKVKFNGDGINPPATINEKINNYIFTARYGYQKLYKTMVTEFYSGVGVRLKKGDKAQYNDWGLIEVDSTEIYFELGVRIGLQFRK